MIIKNKTWLFVLLQSGLLWAGTPILLSFLPGYMEALGYTSSQIGILMAINPFVAIVIQPFLGVFVDKAKSKNLMYALLMIGVVIASVALPFSNQFTYVFAIMLGLSFFQVALIPISESISLETVEHMGRSYAPVRMAGTIFYAVVALIVGALMKRYMNSAFYVMALLGFVNIYIIMKMPRVSGHQSEGRKVPLREMFQDRQLVLYNILAAIAQILMSFYYTFLPILFIKSGGTQDALGWVFFISAMSEVPFLLWADRIIEKFGARFALVVSMVAVGFRIFLLAFVKTPSLFYPISILNGAAFIVFNYVIAVYISKTVRKELRTSGQTVLAVSMGIGRIIGAFAGGILIDSIGLNQTIVGSTILCIVTIILFIYFSEKIDRNRLNMRERKIE